jgi:hypothetical protein
MLVLGEEGEGGPRSDVLQQASRVYMKLYRSLTTTSSVGRSHLLQDHFELWSQII